MMCELLRQMTLGYMMKDVTRTISMTTDWTLKALTYEVVFFNSFRSQTLVCSKLNGEYIQLQRTTGRRRTKYITRSGGGLGGSTTPPAIVGQPYLLQNT